jgi:hypothetical protein
MIYSSHSLIGGELAPNPKPSIQGSMYPSINPNPKPSIQNSSTPSNNPYQGMGTNFMTTSNGFESPGQLYDDIGENVEINEDMPLEVLNSTPSMTEEFIYLDIAMLSLDQIKDSTLTVAAYRMNYTFGKKNPFVEYFINEDGTFPEIDISQSKDNETSISNEIIQYIQRKEGKHPIHDADTLSEMIKGYYIWKHEKDEKNIIFVHWDVSEKKHSPFWKSISEIMHLPLTKPLIPFFHSVPRIMNIYRKDENYSTILQPMFMYGRASFLRTLDDRFGFFYDFIESETELADFPSKYLVRIPEKDDIFFIIRSPINQIKEEILDKNMDKIIHAKACMYYKENHNIWIIKDASSIYSLDPPSVPLKNNSYIENVSKSSNNGFNLGILTK